MLATIYRSNIGKCEEIMNSRTDSKFNKWPGTKNKFKRWDDDKGQHKLNNKNLTGETRAEILRTFPCADALIHKLKCVLFTTPSVARPVTTFSMSLLRFYRLGLMTLLLLSQSKPICKGKITYPSLYFTLSVRINFRSRDVVVLASSLSISNKTAEL